MTLQFTKETFLAAGMGSPSALPGIPPHYADTAAPNVKVAHGFREEEGNCVHQGRIHTILPYTDQDEYDRNLVPREMDCAILENEHLRATFVLDLGGRLWSLYSKTEERELLYVNPVYQPANLALRNAWFSGGVEWNIGMIGHTPLTCSPMFAREGTDENGEPMLIMYEYERKRGTPYCIKATLDKNLLLVNVTIENPSDKPTWMYWWSNIAVDETEGSRVIVPADSSYLYKTEPDGTILVTSEEIPYQGDWDVTYPSNHEKAYDYFFRIHPSQRKWIASVDKDGHGMVQFSTPELQGRKLFVWGAQSQGGKTWNRWLSHGETRYTEIQAGLLRSQMEHCVMPPHHVYTWTEAYAPYSGDPAILHGKDYEKAAQTVEKAILPDFDALDRHFMPKEFGEIKHIGSGWGAVEELCRGSRLSADPAVTFTSAAPEEGCGAKDIAVLIQSGHLPKRDPSHWENMEYVAGEAYIALLENGDTDWYTQLLLACAYYENRQYEKAKDAFLASWKDGQNPIAARSLGWMYTAEKNISEARAWMEKAIPLVGDYARLLIDIIHFYHNHGTDEEIVRLIEGASEPCRKNGRIQMYYAQALVNLDRLEEARKLVTADMTVADMREGEVSTFKLWCDLYGKIMARDENRPLEEIELSEILDRYPIPREIDFRMSYVPIKSK